MYKTIKEATTSEVFLMLDVVRKDLEKNKRDYSNWIKIYKKIGSETKKGFLTEIEKVEKLFKNDKNGDFLKVLEIAFPGDIKENQNIKIIFSNLIKIGRIKTIDTHEELLEIVKKLHDNMSSRISNFLQSYNTSLAISDALGKFYIHINNSYEVIKLQSNTNDKVLKTITAILERYNNNKIIKKDENLYELLSFLEYKFADDNENEKEKTNFSSILLSHIDDYNASVKAGKYFDKLSGKIKQHPELQSMDWKKEKAAKIITNKDFPSYEEENATTIYRYLLDSLDEYENSIVYAAALTKYAGYYNYKRQKEEKCAKKAS